MRYLNRIMDIIDIVSHRLGKALCLTVFLMMLITTLDVIARYVFNNPLLWGWLLNRQLFGLFIMFAGVYTMATGGHIRIEIFYDHFPKKIKMIARLITIASFVTFMGVLITQGFWMGLNSLKMKELAAGAFRLPLYPLKLLIPIVAILFLLEGIVYFIRSDD
ncbi:MAG: TRAP transporter small permease subunit [Deltaproteobacteria bacterium]|nr:TRAP transporter small permease subunit [Deltaproteobacteria bacterium]MBW2024560.1 TRAP transporter small permease subunit [Deltaproteobacteria bacterium]MBW2124757.1 TRAP transporter small permease subunit [Deltaproteobacteria bacterium]